MENAPWLEWLEKHVGEKEWTGEEPSQFVKDCFAHTTYGPLHGVTPASCAATICAALENTGYKSTKSAAAKSFASSSFGVICGIIPGSIGVFEFSPGHRHVTCIRKVFQDGLLECVGGNQGHYLKAAKYDKKYLISTRWPVLAT